MKTLLYPVCFLLGMVTGMALVVLPMIDYSLRGIGE